MSFRSRLVAIAVSLVLAPAVTHGAVTGWTDVVVRVYDTSRVMAGTNLAALDHRRKRWRPHPWTSLADVRSLAV